MPRVLVVDDEAAILSFAGRVLRDAGYEVALASDGPEALRIIAEQQRAFDVFVIDVQMPHMRGDELARRIRQAQPDAKVLYFTGFSDRLFDERTCCGRTKPSSRNRRRSKDSSNRCR